MRQGGHLCLALASFVPDIGAAFVLLAVWLVVEDVASSDHFATFLQCLTLFRSLFCSCWAFAGDFVQLIGAVAVLPDTYIVSLKAPFAPVVDHGPSQHVSWLC